MSQAYCLRIAGLPELDEPGWTSDDFIRDFPVDFTLVLENVADPDHGIFAHQTPIFDSFAASAEYPMQVTTEPGRAGPKASQLCSTNWALLCQRSHIGLLSSLWHCCQRQRHPSMPGVSCSEFIRLRLTED